MLSERASPSGKRLFLGLEALGPWPFELPGGRIIPEEGRHATLIFFGYVREECVLHLTNITPPPPWKVGLTAVANAPLLLPKKKPNCLSWEIELLEQKEQLFAYQESLSNLFIEEKLLHPKEAALGFLPHITLARKPFDHKAWFGSFSKQLTALGSMHLYESLGSSTYKPLHTWPVISPFQEISHTADLAFCVRGQSLESLALHAFMALNKACPSLFRYMQPWTEVRSFDEMVALINHSISSMDIEEGSPFKAVSYHGEIKNLENGVLEWEMIVDV